MCSLIGQQKLFSGEPFLLFSRRRGGLLHMQGLLHIKCQYLATWSTPFKSALRCLPWNVNATNALNNEHGEPCLYKHGCTLSWCRPKDKSVMDGVCYPRLDRPCRALQCRKTVLFDWALLSLNATINGLFFLDDVTTITWIEEGN